LIASCSIILLATSAFSLEKNDILDERDIERLFQCAASCDTDCVEGYLDRGVSPDIKEKTDIGEFPLIYHAVSANCKSVIEILIEHGANVDISDDYGKTPLGTAVMEGEWDTESYLLENGAALYTSDESYYGKYKLHYAVFINDIKMAKKLVDEGYDVNERMTECDANIFYKYLLEGDDGHTPLHEAAQFNRMDIAELLIDAGANVDAVTDGDGYTPLIISAARSSLNTTELLIEKNADVNLTAKKSKYSALHAAASDCDVNAVSYLLQNGADVNAKLVDTDKDWISFDGLTPLNLSSLTGFLSLKCEKTIKILIGNGASFKTSEGKILYGDEAYEYLKDMYIIQK